MKLLGKGRLVVMECWKSEYLSRSKSPRANISRPLEEIEAAAGTVVVPEPEVAPAYVPPIFSMSDDEDDDDMPRFGKRPLPIVSMPQSPPLSAQTASASLIRKQPTSNASRLFTADELAVLPDGLLDRQRQKQLAKKAKKKRMAAGKTENELMAGFLDMGVDEDLHAGIDVQVPVVRPTKKALRKEKKKAQKVERPGASEIEMDPEAKREADFASFLQQVGDDDMDEEL